MITIKDLIATAAARAARRARRLDAPADRVRGVRRRSATARSSTTSTMSRWSRARSPASRTCWCGSTPSASPATSSTRCAATAAGSCSGAGDDRAGGRGASCSTSRQEGRGIGLLNKLRAYALQEEGLDTVEANERLGLPADLRDFGIGAQILATSGSPRSASSPTTRKKIHALEGYGLSVTEQIPIEQPPNPENVAYLRTKRDKLGHTLHHQGLDLDGEMLCASASGEPAARRALMARYALVVARFYEDLAARLEAGARGVFERSGGSVEVFAVPGAFELAAAARYVAVSGRFAGVVCLGAVIRGETDHYDHVCAAAARGIQEVGLSTGVPCRLRRADRRHPRAGARALGRGPARQRRARRAGGARAGRNPRALASSARLPAPWPRYVTPARRARHSATTAATRWSRHAVASTRTCRRCASWTGTAPPRRVYVCTRCLKAGKVTKAR